MTTPSAYVGRATRRIDAPDKLTGAERYAGDVTLPGLLHARLVTSPHASARLVAVDAGAALALPGVVAVFTADDLASRWATPPTPPPLAVGRVAYAGQPVAVVLAEGEAIAADAALRVRVDYEPTPAVVDAEAALAPGAPLAIDETMRGGEAGAAHTDVPSATETRALPPNVAAVVHFRRGDVDRGLAESDVVVTRTYRTRRTHQGYLEPHATVAMMEPTGGLAIWTATQAMFFCRTAVARAVGLPEHRIRLTAMPIGGGFGGKYIPLYEPLVALLALVARRPVRLVLSRIEEFTSTNPAPACLIELTTGATRAGALRALKARVLVDVGAFHGEAPTSGLCQMLGASYTVPHLDIEGVDVHTNTTPPGSYRAPGGPQAAFAIESNIDLLARELGLDPIDFRLRNIAEEGDPRPDGSPWKPIAMRECLERLRDHPAWTTPTGPDEGVGVAVSACGGLCEPAAATCRLNEDGSLAVIVGAQDISGAYTSFALMAAETFGVDPSAVQVIAADSLVAPYAGVAGGSKTTYTVGAAVVEAAAAARRQALAIAAEELETSPDDLEIVGGEARVKGAPGRGLPLAALAGLTMVFGGRHAPVVATGAVAPAAGYAGAAAHLARVRVDRETGVVRVTRYVAAQDVGRAINPAAVDGQIRGAVVQGIGWALREGMAYDDDGGPLHASFLDYAMPRAGDAPSIETIVLEIPAPIGPFGAKGVGEPPIIPVAGAIANAIADATGARLGELPMTPEAVGRAQGGAASGAATAP